GSVKEYVPIRFATAAPRIPNQQRIVAQAAQEAVSHAVADRALGLAQFAGKSGRVEVNGVYPQSDSDLLDYVAAAVEGEMALAGMRVIPRAAPVRVRTEGDGPAQVMVSASSMPEPPDQAPEVRMVASLDWGGIDFEDRKYVVGSHVAATIVIGILTLGIGGILYAAVAKLTAHTFTL